MTQEDKDLLLMDLSARLPYGVKTHVKSWRDLKMYEDIYVVKSTFPSLNEVHVQSKIGSLDVIIGYYDYDIKPYLFPLLSMTEEQKQELNSLLPVGVSLQINSNNFTYFEIDTDIVCCFHIEFWDKFFDWLNKNHFDHRGLIEKGLALDATNKNIY